MEVDGPEYDQLWGIFGVRARVVRMQLGEQQMELMEFLSPPDVRPIPVPSYSNDLWFQHFAIVVRDMDERLGAATQTSCPTDFSAAADDSVSNAGGSGHQSHQVPRSRWAQSGTALVSRGKGNPIWKQPGHDVFLGIDHTAMTVRSTENSITFYRDLLGLTVAGGTFNMGTQQEHLDSLPGARARVTGLATKIGPPGVEFLEYQLPIAGRPIPADSHPTDLWYWQTTVVVPDVEAAAMTLRGLAQFVSSLGG